MHLIPPSINLRGTPSAFVPVYVLSGIWQSAGWNSIIFIAALSSVDGQLYDAAKVDGANRWQQVIHVELPALVPTIVILLIMNMGRVLSVGFEKVFLMQNDMNLPVSEVISTYVFNVGVQSGQFSFGSAVGLFNTVINFAFLMIANMVSKKAADQPDVGGIEHESSWKENAAESVRPYFLYFCNGNCSCCIGDSIVPHVLYSDCLLQ